MSNKKQKLRTAAEVINRLKWCPLPPAAAGSGGTQQQQQRQENEAAVEEASVVIGYDDKINGPMEVPLEDFVPIQEGGNIPEHRIWYFRQRPEEQVPLPEQEEGDSVTNTVTSGDEADPQEADENDPSARFSDGEIQSMILWDRLGRVDKIFASSGNGANDNMVSLATIQNVRSAMKNMALIEAQKNQSRCNDYQIELFNHLMNLVHTNSSFYCKDQELNHEDTGGTRKTYRIFDYRMASYEDFCQPGALECRGIMYEVRPTATTRAAPGGGGGRDAAADVVPIRLVCHPMEKFFNLNENPFTMNLDLTDVDCIEEKADGSLISSFLVNPGQNRELKLKSKASIRSDQAIQAQAWLDHPDRYRLKDEVTRLALQFDCTTNMEWVAPSNRVVVGYPDEELRILTVRFNANGDYMDKDDLPGWAQELRRRWTPRIVLDEEDENSASSFISTIPSMQGIEGFVVRLRVTGMRVKIKTNWYLALHPIMRSVNNPKALYRAVLEEATDDLKSHFHQDPIALKRIINMEAFVRNQFQSLVTHVEDFHHANQHLGRKEYAMLARKTVEKNEFGLVMAKYSDRPVVYKDHMLNQAKVLFA